MAEGGFTRRASLVRFGGLLVAGLTTGGWKVAESARGASTGPAGVASGAVTCVLSPEMTEGPFYVGGEKLRRNITEGKPGTPLTLRLGVVDASSCKAIKGAFVDIWHADASGVYSGEQMENTVGQNYLRGIQKTDAKGIATFQTVYPGWYQGRAVHIHVKVHLGGSVVHTGQFFFSDTLTDSVYKKTPYSKRPNRDTRNAADSIYRNGGSKSMLAVKRSKTGYVGTITMGVHRS